MTNQRDISRRSTRRRGSALRVALVAALVPLAGASLRAEVPSEFIGRWSSSPPRCEQVNGEVDLLTVDPDTLDFYEIACELGRPSRLNDEIRIPAICQKGVSPLSRGTVILRQMKPETIELSLQDFKWSSPAPVSFHRCRSDQPQ